jgi:DNA-binding HxlR family transcriptional regulator
MASTPPKKRHPYDQWSPDSRALDLVGDKWTLLIVRDLASGPRRFVELQRTLPGISTEQLRSRLNRMVADGLLTRQRYREVPPRVDYELTDRSRELLGVIGELARWGYEWCWGTPRPGEAIDVGAILRTAPGLLSPGPHVRGSLACEVDDRTYVLTAAGGSVTIAETPTEAPDGRVSGTQDAWVRALAPGGSLSELAVTGSVSLADALLGPLVAAAGQAGSQAA